jgi:hypothetical protein
MIEWDNNILNIDGDRNMFYKLGCPTTCALLLGPTKTLAAIYISFMF